MNSPCDDPKCTCKDCTQIRELQLSASSEVVLRRMRRCLHELETLPPTEHKKWAATYRSGKGKIKISMWYIPDNQDERFYEEQS